MKKTMVSVKLRLHLLAHYMRHKKVNNKNNNKKMIEIPKALETSPHNRI